MSTEQINNWCLPVLNRCLSHVADPFLRLVPLSPLLGTQNFGHLLLLGVNLDWATPAAGVMSTPGGHHEALGPRSRLLIQLPRTCCLRCCHSHQNRCDFQL